jgi:peroxiredoxin
MFKKLLQHRGIKLTLEILVLLLIYFAIKAYIQRDLIQGTAPPIQSTLLDGQAVNLQSYQGKPLLLHFWATWCGVCKLEEDSIDAISKDHPVVTVAMSSGSNKEIEAYLKENNLSFPVINDNDGELAQRYGVSGVPASFIINAAGKISYTEVGYTTGWGLRFRLWLAE